MTTHQYLYASLPPPPPSSPVTSAAPTSASSSITTTTSSPSTAGSLPEFYTVYSSNLTSPIPNSVIPQSPMAAYSLLPGIAFAVGPGSSSPASSVNSDSNGLNTPLNLDYSDVETISYNEVVNGYGSRTKRPVHNFNSSFSGCCKLNYNLDSPSSVSYGHSSPRSSNSRNNNNNNNSSSGGNYRMLLPKPNLRKKLSSQLVDSYESNHDQEQQLSSSDQQQQQQLVVPGFGAVSTPPPNSGDIMKSRTFKHIHGRQPHLVAKSVNGVTVMAYPSPLATSSSASGSNPTMMNVTAKDHQYLINEEYRYAEMTNRLSCPMTPPATPVVTDASATHPDGIPINYRVSNGASNQLNKIQSLSL